MDRPGGFLCLKPGSSLWRVLRTRALAMGLVWGLIETLVLTIAISPIFGPLSNHSVNLDLYALLQLVFIFAIAFGFLVGFIQLDAYRSMRSLLVSKLVGIPAFIGVLIYGSPAFPQLWDPSHPSSQTLGSFLGMYIFGLGFVIVIGEVFATPLGAMFGESAMGKGLVRSMRLTLTRLMQKRLLKRVQPRTET